MGGESVFGSPSASDRARTDTSLAPLCRAELLAAVSLISDLGMGQPMEHALRQCLIAARLGDRIGLDDPQREAVYYTGLLAWVGCHVDSYEQAKWFGDEAAMKADVRTVDFTSAGADVAFLLRHLGSGMGRRQRLRAAVDFVRDGGMSYMDKMLETHWRAADTLAVALGFDDDVRESMAQTFERWDGRGDPDGLKGDEIALTARLVNLADVAEVYFQAGGVEAAVAVARERSGTQFDPALVDAFCDSAPELFAELETVPTWDAVIASEPRLAEPLSDDVAEAAFGAVADFADVKSPFTIGHSRGVAELAAAAAGHAGFPAADVTVLRRASLLHDLGRIGVSNMVWDKPGPLSLAEQERVRLHPYLTARSLASSPALAEVGAVAAQHHERLDGSGYPKGVRGDAITPGGRFLAAADVYRAGTEPRPHRPALGPSDTASLLRAEVRAGRLDGDAVEAVLRAAGHRPRRRAQAVAGLTVRELEVVRLLARGRSAKQIAHELGIARKTASNHIEHIYTKLGVSNRALVSLFAAKHGLVDPDLDLQDDGSA